MPTVTTSDNVTIFYKDWGTGQPVVFSHGWPLTADAWDGPANFVASHGFRAIAHDRRGGGRSSQPWDGNDLDHYADDLASVIKDLDARGYKPRVLFLEATDAVLVRRFEQVRRGHPLQGDGRLGRAYVAYGLGNFAWYSPGPTGVLTLTVQPPREPAGRARVTASRWWPAEIGADGLAARVRGPDVDAFAAERAELRTCAALG